MSAQLIARSPDLAQLRDEGYSLAVQEGCVFVSGIPYVTAAGVVAYGILVSTLTVSGATTMRPDSHVVSFIGEVPCDNHGARLNSIINTERHQPAPGIDADFQFSSKPHAGYENYYDKLTAYIRILTGYAQAVDPSASPTRGAAAFAPTASPFAYEDTATSRAGIASATAKLAGHKIAILGLGGTGSYVLDLVTKTPVAEIHLFDRDVFANHNAFRAPGAARLEELEETPLKVDYFAARYSAMHRHIHAHAVFVDADNVHDLGSMDFVFVCIDDGPSRRLITESLSVAGVAFVDVGIGVELVPELKAITGLVRTTSATARHNAHLARRLPFAGAQPEDDYRSNVQVADLNMLNAALAVGRWKRICGFYVDQEKEHHSVYAVSGNHLLNEEAA